MSKKYDIDTLGRNSHSNSLNISRNKSDKSDSCRRNKEIKKVTDSKTAKGKLINKIHREFPRKIFLGDIKINNYEFDILIEYFKIKYNYMRTSNTHVIVDPVFCIALIQIGIRYYDGAFWPHVKKVLDNTYFNNNHHEWIKNSFLETLIHYDKIQADEKKRVETILMHGFVTDIFAEKFFDFLYAFYTMDIDRDISRLNRDLMNELICIIEKNDNSGRTYFLVEHTVDAVKKNKRSAKNRIRHYLKLIDKAFWGEALPTSSNNRLMKKFLDWKDTAVEFTKERLQYGGIGKRCKKSYSSPYLKYKGTNDTFVLVLPPQIIRFEELKDVLWIIESECFIKKIEVNPYAQGVTGYKADSFEISIDKEFIFNWFNISLMNGDESIRTFKIARDIIRFFDEDGDFIRNDSLFPSRAYSFTKSGLKPESEAMTEEFDDGIILRTAYEFVNGDIIRIPDGRPLAVGGKLTEGILPRGVVPGVSAGEYNKSVYKDIPSVFVKTLPSRVSGTAIRVNNEIFPLSLKKRLHEGVSEFELFDGSGEKGYLIDLKVFGCKNDGEYNIIVDVPNDRTIRNWKFVLISNLEFKFEDAPYIFNARGTLSIVNNSEFNVKKDSQVEILDKKYYNFDIIPGEEKIYLNYKGIDIGFEIPAISYKFYNENWQTGPHIDIWHSDFEPRLSVSYNADKIRFFMDDTGDDEEHSKTFIKNKSKGIFECDLNIFKSWFDRDQIIRNIFIDLPGTTGPILFARIITRSIFSSGVLRADFNKNKLLGDFKIIGYSDYYVDIVYDGKLVAEKVKLEGKHLEMDAELRTGIYKITVYESEEDESGFGDSIYYEIGTVDTELLNPEDLNGMSIKLMQIHKKDDNSSFLPLKKYEYTVVDLKSIEDNTYSGKMVVSVKTEVFATFSVIIEFYDRGDLQKSYITFEDEDEYTEFLYDEYKKIIVKKEDNSITRSQAYRRYKFSLYPDDYVFEVMFIERPENADSDVDDGIYNNLNGFAKKKIWLNASIFKK